MIFPPEIARLILEGHKTQTRQLVKPGERLIPANTWYVGQLPLPEACIERLPVPTIRDVNYKLKWQTGKTYAVQPGRTKAAIGRIRLTAIRRERLKDITLEDIRAEGFTGASDKHAVRFWIALWNSINRKPGTRWADSPDVWVLTFEVVK